EHPGELLQALRRHGVRLLVPPLLRESELDRPRGPDHPVGRRLLGVARADEGDRHRAPQRLYELLLRLPDSGRERGSEPRPARPAVLRPVPGGVRAVEPPAAAGSTRSTRRSAAEAPGRCSSDTPDRRRTAPSLRETRAASPRRPRTSSRRRTGSRRAGHGARTRLIAPPYASMRMLPPPSAGSFCRCSIFWIIAWIPPLGSGVAT